MIIGLLGPAGSGKSTVAARLVERHDARRYALADPLKNMVKRAFELSEEQVRGTQEQKETADPRYLVTPRWLMQRIGTEGARQEFGTNFWTDQVLARIRGDDSSLAVIEDVRFPDESRAIIAAGGEVWRLHPPADDVAEASAQSAGAHASEQGWLQAPATLEIRPSARGLAELHALVDIAAQETIASARRDVNPKDRALALLAESGVARGQIWRHRKSGDDYVVTGVALDEPTLAPMVVYKSAECQWIRALAVFLDRFERVKFP